MSHEEVFFFDVFSSYHGVKVRGPKHVLCAPLLLCLAHISGTQRLHLDLPCSEIRYGRIATAFYDQERIAME